MGATLDETAMADFKTNSNSDLRNLDGTKQAKLVSGMSNTTYMTAQPYQVATGRKVGASPPQLPQVMRQNLLPDLNLNRKTQKSALQMKQASVGGLGSEISPELAASIVKNYILPMFETTEKKNLRNKYNKMSQIAN